MKEEEELLARRVLRWLTWTASHWLSQHPRWLEHHLPMATIKHVWFFVWPLSLEMLLIWVIWYLVKSRRSANVSTPGSRLNPVSPDEELPTPAESGFAAGQSEMAPIPSNLVNEKSKDVVFAEMREQLNEVSRRISAPKYFCINGHVQPEDLQVEPDKCAVCHAAVVSKCDCGRPLDLWYNYRGGSGKLVSGRDYCLWCKRITPWALLRFLNPDGSSEFTVYEEALIEHMTDRPTPENVGLSFQDMQGAPGEKWYERVFGHRIPITDPKHPKHGLWLEHLAQSSSFKSNLIRGWEAANKEAQAARTQRLAEEAAWRDFSGWQFEKELTWVLSRRGHKVEHVGGPGDGGADLIINSDRGRIVVQCKAHSTRIGPAAIRDLFGCLQHHDAIEGWLVGIEGFSQAAQSFARGKPIKLLTIRQVLEGLEGDPQTTRTGQAPRLEP
jgi:hypothetical protein